MSDSILFSSFRLGALQVPNRLVMAPMTRNRAEGPGNVPNALMETYYAQRATAGLIVTEGSQVAPEGQGYPNTPGIYSAEQVEGWKKVTSAVHAQGGRIFLQLWHVGRISHPSLQPNQQKPVAPSAIKPAGKAMTLEGLKPFETPRALETSEIPAVVAQYRKAAANALAAGFDGVEIHGANGYLIDQFLRDGTNHRTDVYGGPIANRVRFLQEVAQAVIEVWGKERVGVRLAPGGAFNDMSDSNPEATFSHAVSALNELGVGYVHIKESDATDVRHGGVIVPTKILRDRFKGPFIVNTGYTRERAEAAISGGLADLVAFGVPFLANPDLVTRFKNGSPLNPPDVKTFYVPGAKGYTDYPALV